jgi:hypothetical protein
MDSQAFGILLVGLFGDLPARLWSPGFSGPSWRFFFFGAVPARLDSPAFRFSTGFCMFSRFGGDLPVLLCSPGFLGLSRLGSAPPGSSISCLPGQVSGLSGFRFFPGLAVFPALLVFGCFGAPRLFGQLPVLTAFWCSPDNLVLCWLVK